MEESEIMEGSDTFTASDLGDTHSSTDMNNALADRNQIGKGDVVGGMSNDDTASDAAM